MVTVSPLDVLAGALPGPGKPPRSTPLPAGHDQRGPTGYEVTDFEVGDVVMFKANAENWTDVSRYAAPTGALARVVAIEPGGWPGMIEVKWIDRWEHRQKDGGYRAYQFWPATDPTAELTLFELSDLTDTEDR